MYSLGEQPGKFVSYYDILHVRPDASNDEIRNAYHNLAKRFHPDRVPPSQDRRLAALRFRLINEAYDTLKTEEKRRRYNRTMEIRAGKLPRARNDNRRGLLGFLADIFSPARDTA